MAWSGLSGAGEHHDARRALAEQRSIQLRSVSLGVADGSDVGVDVTLQPFGADLLLEVHALAPAAVGASPLSGTLRGFAHEIRNPLAGMRGAAQLLQRRVEDGELRALAGVVIDEADRRS